MGFLAEENSLDNIVIYFAGDSGDGIQLTGSQFASVVAKTGNVVTLPEYPSEIRAPQGSVSGVSGYQVNFGDETVLTSGDYADILVAMNPAALKVNLKKVSHSGVVIVDKDAFFQKNLEKAGYVDGCNPIEEDSVNGKKLFALPITSQTLQALEHSELSKTERARCKNFFTLGVVLWLHEQDPDSIITYLSTKFRDRPEIADANIEVLREGILYAQNSGLFKSRYKVRRSGLAAGTYREISGNQAVALGLVAAAKKAGLSLFLGSYPITPATEILHHLAPLKNYVSMKTFQAEDEIAAVCGAVGASFAGALAATSTSGPGMSLKSEALGLAVMSELPLVIIDVQRGGPSTGLPTKTEQSDLMQALYGRHGECPMPVLAARSPADCFYQTLEATRLAIKYMTPVILLLDAYIGNGSEPMMIPEVDDLPDLATLHTEIEVENFSPYRRDEKTRARNWAIPGMAGLQHRIGGLEKDYDTGAISHDAENHNRMTRIRQEKVDRIAKDTPGLKVFGDEQGDVLILSWGSTYGAIRGKVMSYRRAGHSVSHAHFTQINPMPANTGELLASFKKVVVAEMNLGQLNQLIRAKYLVNTHSLTKVKGVPFKEHEIESVVDELL